MDKYKELTGLDEYGMGHVNDELDLEINIRSFVLEYSSTIDPLFAYRFIKSANSPVERGFRKHCIEKGATVGINPELLYVAILSDDFEEKLKEFTCLDKLKCNVVSRSHPLDKERFEQFHDQEQVACERTRLDRPRQ